MSIGKLKSNVPGGTGQIKVRTKPSLSADFVSKNIGTEVMLLGATHTDSDGYRWYQIQFDGAKTGWVRNDVITILPDTTPPAAAPDNTRLYFETNHRQVRVFEEGLAVLMNVYNKDSNKTEVNHVAVTKLPIDSFSNTYLATQNGRSYHATFVHLGSTQLRIVDSASGIDIEPAEPGFGARGTEYQRT